MIVDDPERIADDLLDSESSVEEPVNNVDNHEQALSRVGSSLASHAVQDSEGVEQLAENTHTVTELLEILGRRDSSCQLTIHDAHKLINEGYGWIVVDNLNILSILTTTRLPARSLTLAKVEQSPLALITSLDFMLV